MTDRELDLLVAQQVFGEDVRYVAHRDMIPEASRGKTYLRYRCMRCDVEWRHYEDVSGDCPESRHPKMPYSATGDGMLAVIEKMQTKDWLVTVTKGLCGWRVEEERMQFEAEFRQCVEPWGVVETYDPSAPRAVAIAALRALGVTV